MASLLRSGSAAVSRSASSSSAVCSRRSLHKLRPYPNLDLDKGIPGFMDPADLKVVAIDYQQGLLDRLNDVVRGTDYEPLTVAETVNKAKNDPAASLIFNYASNALNNSLFLDGIASQVGSFATSPFVHYIHSSWPQRNPAETPLKPFETAFYAQVDAMTASGWLWLVQEVKHDRNRISFRTSYGAGTVLYNFRTQPGPRYDAFPPPLPKARPSLVDPEAYKDLPPPLERTAWDSEDGEAEPRTGTVPKPKTPAPSSEFEAASTAEDPLVKEEWKVYPLAVLSIHERAYVNQFGHNERSTYAQRWLGALDWNKVWARTSRRDMVDLSGINLTESEAEKQRTQESFDPIPFRISR